MEQPAPQHNESAQTPQTTHDEGARDEGARDVAIRAEYVAADPSLIDLSSFATLPLISEQSPVSELCSAVAQGVECRYGDTCQFNHDTVAYLAAKPSPVRDTCPFEARAQCCPYGVTCLCGPTHDMTKSGNNVADTSERNFLSKEVQQQLRKKSYDFSRADAQIKKTAREARAERNNIDWHRKLILAPLTTVGNLPFRRLCVTLGADVTLGEMALAQNIVKGERQEWSLIRRHESEAIFGVQLAGAHVDTLTRAVQLLTDPENEISVDFIDLNVGCPIDLVTKKGMGCALVNRPSHLTALLRGMVLTAHHVPVTVKLRIGAQDYSNKLLGPDLVPVEKRGTIHKDILPHLADIGVSAATIHGRSQRQRYLRSADWQYIAHCGEILAEHNIPLIGNGDVYNWEEAQHHFDHDHVTALMIARSALIKPWLFKEIKEQRHIDYTATERWQLIGQFVSHGLAHWGSDRRGVETTRRFLLEWLSFTHRYVPIGLLQHVQPLSIHHRAASRLQARDQFETILSSPLVADWQRIAAWFLGPVPSSEAKSTFTPTHTAGWQDQQNG